MNDLWKSSKSSSLVLILTGLVGVCVLAFAYHQHHFTEILSGVIGGLTIILGIVTAEWLRTAREDSEANVSRLHTLQLNYYPLILNPDFLLGDETVPLIKEQTKTFYDVNYNLLLLATKTRWPQPNAKKIRLQALSLRAKNLAMFRDAVENRHLWSAEKRHGLQIEMNELADTVFTRRKRDVEIAREIYYKSRETEPREGMSMVWLMQAERENRK